VIQNEILEWFILDWAQAVPNEGRGRPTTITPLHLAAKKRCGECTMDALLTALFNLGSDNVS